MDQADGFADEMLAPFRSAAVASARNVSSPRCERNSSSCPCHRFRKSLRSSRPS